MGKIVVITTEGDGRRHFVNELHRRTNAVAFAVIQLPKRRPLWGKLQRVYQKIDLFRMPLEFYYFLYNRFSSKQRALLTILKRCTLSPDGGEYLPTTVTTRNINSDQHIQKLLSDTKPDLIVIWGGGIVGKSILESAGRVLNLHAGVCPHYRGINTNLHALLRDDWDNIGMTIHDAVLKVDAGGVLDIIKVSRHQSPSNYFRELNDKAFERYLQIATDICRGKVVMATPQDLTIGHNYTMREWNYEKQYQLAKKLEEWQKKY